MVALPLVGAVGVAFASMNEGLYRLLVKEDAVLEWAQVLAYGAVVVIAAATLRAHWRHRDSSAAVVVAGLALVSLLAIGEELSWGQRIVGFETPDIAAANRQGELTLHNDARLEDPARIALLVGAVYGVLAPLVTPRRTPLVPPRTLITFFAAVVAYIAYRVLLLDHPTYVEAKFSEWPETCFAVALCLWCADIGKSRRLVGTRRAPARPSSRMSQDRQRVERLGVRGPGGPIVSRLPSGVRAAHPAPRYSSLRPPQEIEDQDDQQDDDENPDDSVSGSSDR
jgi:hypothetical protein